MNKKQIILKTKEILKSDLNQYKVIGEGVFGTVLDLKDGTIIKLVLKKSSGTGKPLDKVKTEAKILEQLVVSNKDSIVVPRLIDYGKITGQLTHPFDKYAFWIRMTKISGKVIRISEKKFISKRHKLQLAEQISFSINFINKKLESIRINKTKELKFDKKLDKISEELKVDHFIKVSIKKLKVISKKLSYPKRRVIHGDFNITNLLFKHNLICGIVDFAETRIGHVEEDLASIISDLVSISIYYIIISILFIKSNSIFLYIV